MQMAQYNKHKKWLEILAGKDFPPTLLCRTSTKIHRERRRQDGSFENEALENEDRSTKHPKNSKTKTPKVEIM